EEPAEEVVTRITAAGGEAVANFDDVSSWEGAGRLVQQAIDAFGRLDVVVANAGIARNKPLLELPPETFELVQRVHVFGTFNVIKHAWPHLVERRYGRLVLTSSSAGYHGLTGDVSYAVAKAGIIGFTKSLAWEGQEYGIHANAISPGGAASRMT